jgi:hypothetical protein
LRHALEPLETEMSKAKYQHFTPRLHLRRFMGAQPARSVWEYDKIRLSMSPKIPESTGGQKHLYSVRNERGELDHTVDEMLTDIENRAVAGYEKLLSGEIPWADDRAAFAVFVATMYTRSPGMLRSLAEAYGKMLQIDIGARWSNRKRFEASLDQMAAATGNAIDDRDGLWDFWQDKQGFSIGTSIQHGLIGIGASETIAQILFERSWYIFDAVEGYFIKSDQAVERWSPTAHPVMGDGGFLNDAAEVTMPLSPQRMVMITGQQLGVSRLALFKEQVDTANALRARNAERFIWADRRDPAVLQLVKDFAESKRELSVGWGEELADVTVERSLRGRGNKEQ